MHVKYKEDYELICGSGKVFISDLISITHACTERLARHQNLLSGTRIRNTKHAKKLVEPTSDHEFSQHIELTERMQALLIIITD